VKTLLVLFGSLKLAKLFTTVGTMLVSIVVYSFVFGWLYAAGFVLLILIHEMGHYIAARQRGLDVGAPTFIPFVGAWIQMKQMPHDVETEAYVGFAGPLVGSAGALACYYLSRHYDSSLLLALAYSGFMINLFNLIPISPLDGGRITAVLSPKVWLLGVPLLAGLFFYMPSPMLVLVAILAVPQLIKAFRYDPEDPEHGGYYRVSAETKVTYALYYLGLTAFLAVMTYDLHEALAGIRS